MNIKSELKKQEYKFLSFITLPTILFALIISIVLFLLTFMIGQVLWLKLIFISISIIGVYFYVYDNNRDKKDEIYTLKQGFTYIILVLLFLEIPLYFISQHEQIIPISIIFETKVKDGDKIDPKCEEYCKHKQINYIRLNVFNKNNNDLLGYRIFDIDDPKRKLYTTIITKHVYYDYVPFLIFEEKFNYIHKDKLND